MVDPGYPFSTVGGQPPLWKVMDSTGSAGLQQGEEALSYPEEGLPGPSDSSELVSSALGSCFMLVQGHQELRD